MPTTATAQESEIEIVDEHTGVACDPCDIHLEGESHVTALPAGVIIFGCHDEFEISLNHGASGELQWAGTEHGAPGCILVNCVTGDEGHWPIGNPGELVTGEEHANVRLCMRNWNTGTELHCDLELHVEREVDVPRDPRAHHYFFSTESLCSGGARRFEGFWEIEDDEVHDEVEVVHHDA